MPKFTLASGKFISLSSTKSFEEAITATREQVELIEQGRTTARQAVHYLLTEFPVLRRHRVGIHPLSCLMDGFARETLGCT